MARESPYPAEMRARAVRMVGEIRPNYDGGFAAIKVVVARLGIGSAETLRKWVRRAEVDAGTRPGITTAENEQIKALKREVAELRRANEILKAASAFFRGRARPATGALVRFIGEQKDSFGVEPVCQVLSEHGWRIAPGTYYAAVKRPPSARSVRDAEILTAILRLRQAGYEEVHGARKTWLALNRAGIRVARSMRQATRSPIPVPCGLKFTARTAEWVGLFRAPGTQPVPPRRSRANVTGRGTRFRRRCRASGG
jgi:transposase-like protein